MSLRLRLLNLVLRRAVRPRLAATETPAQAEREFDRGARAMFRVPRGEGLGPRGGGAGAAPPGEPDRGARGGGRWPDPPFPRRRLRRGERADALRDAGAAFGGCRGAGRCARLPSRGGGACARGLRGCLRGLGCADARGLAALPHRAGRGQRGRRDRAGASGMALRTGDAARWSLRLLAVGRPDAVGRIASENAEDDPLLPGAQIGELVEAIRGALPAEDPRLSPLFAAFPGAPPVLLQAGLTEILRDDTLRMADRLRRRARR